MFELSWSLRLLAGLEKLQKGLPWGRRLFHHSSIYPVFVSISHSLNSYTLSCIIVHRDPWISRFLFHLSFQAYSDFRFYILDMFPPLCLGLLISGKNQHNVCLDLNPPVCWNNTSAVASHQEGSGFDPAGWGLSALDRTGAFYTGLKNFSQPALTEAPLWVDALKASRKMLHSILCVSFGPSS